MGKYKKDPIKEFTYDKIMEHERKPIAEALVSEYNRATNLIKEISKVQTKVQEAGTASNTQPAEGENDTQAKARLAKVLNAVVNKLNEINFKSFDTYLLPDTSINTQTQSQGHDEDEVDMKILSKQLQNHINSTLIQKCSQVPQVNDSLNGFLLLTMHSLQLTLKAIK
jgi:hypothetical protein